MTTSDRYDDLRHEAKNGQLDGRKLFDFARNLEWDLFGSPPDLNESRPDLAADPRALQMLDALAALELVEPDDGALPRQRAIMLDVLGYPSEAASVFVVAAERFDREFLDKTGLTGDEDEWAKTARWHAARCYVEAGYELAARALLPQLDDEDAQEIVAMLTEGT